jgi:hypothetical protein
LHVLQMGGEKAKKVESQGNKNREGKHVSM